MRSNPSAPVTDRLRGRAGQRQRRRRLQAEPLCRDCLTKAPPRTTAATEVDHVKPLALGGNDTDENCRSLCSACHLDRTREAFGYRRRVAVSVEGWPVE